MAKKWGSGLQVTKQESSKNSVFSLTFPAIEGFERFFSYFLRLDQIFFLLRVFLFRFFFPFWVRIMSSKASSISVCFGLIQLAFFSLLHFLLYFFTSFTSKVYLFLTNLIVTLKFISSREFSTTAISSCPHSTLPWRLLHCCMCSIPCNRTMSWFTSHIICWRLQSNKQMPD